MGSDVIISGYVSMDRILLVENELRSGHTSIINNEDNAKVYYGGCPINIAYALTRYNVSNLPIIRVGKDYVDIGFYDFLRNNNINDDAVTFIQEACTSNCYLVEDKQGNHTTVFYPGAMDNKYFVPMNSSWFKNAKLGVITVGPLKDNVNFLVECKKNKLSLVFGAKLDYSAFPREFLIETLLYSEIIFANEEEAKEISDILGCNVITDLFNKGNAKIIIITKGIKGSSVYTNENNVINKVDIGILKVDKCVDTTGSGDSYMAGFIYGLINNYPITDCAKLGAISSYFVIQAMGCNTNVASEEQLVEMLKLHGGKL